MSLWLIALVGCHHHGALESATEQRAPRRQAEVSHEAPPPPAPQGRPVDAGFWVSLNGAVGTGISADWSGDAFGSDPEVVHLRHEQTGAAVDMWLGAVPPEPLCDAPEYVAALELTRAVPSLQEVRVSRCAPDEADGRGQTVWDGRIGVVPARVALSWPAGQGLRARHASSALLNSLECLRLCDVEGPAVPSAEE